MPHPREPPVVHPTSMSGEKIMVIAALLMLFLAFLVIIVLSHLPIWV